MLGRKTYTQEELDQAERAVDQTVVKLDIGDRIKLSVAQSERLSKAFFAEIDCKFV